MIEYLNSDLCMQFMLLVVPIAAINIAIDTWALFWVKHAIQCTPNLFASTMETYCHDSPFELLVNG